MVSSFANIDQAAVPAEDTGVQQALAAPVSAEIVPDSYFQNDEIEGDFDASDIKVPRLGVVQAVGPLSVLFPPGLVIYNKETAIGTAVKNPAGVITGTEGLVITLVRLKKYFVEDLPYTEDGPIPQYFKTLDDARRAGFLPVQDKRQMGPAHRYVRPVLDADILIRGDASSISFPFEFAGTPYAMARWTLQNTAYSRVGKQFITDSKLALRAGVSTKFYTVSTKREKLGANWVFVPKATITGVNTPEFVEWVRSVAL